MPILMKHKENNLLKNISDDLEWNISTDPWYNFLRVIELHLFSQAEFTGWLIVDTQY